MYRVLFQGDRHACARDDTVFFTVFARKRSDEAISREGDFLRVLSPIVGVADTPPEGGSEGLFTRKQLCPGGGLPRDIAYRAARVGFGYRYGTLVSGFAAYFYD